MQTKNKKTNARKPALIIISVIGLLASLYIIGNGLSNLHQASQEVIDACKALKAAVIDEGIALGNLPAAFRTPADIDHYTNAVIDYNARCGHDTGVLLQ